MVLAINIVSVLGKKTILKEIQTIENNNGQYNTTDKTTKQKMTEYNITIQ